MATAVRLGLEGIFFNFHESLMRTHNVQRVLLLYCWTSAKDTNDADYLVDQILGTTAVVLMYRNSIGSLSRTPNTGLARLSCVRAEFVFQIRS